MMGNWLRWRHQKWQTLASVYLDGELSAAERRRFESHLAACNVCQQELSELQFAVRTLKSMPEVPPPRSFALTPQMVAARRETRGTGVVRAYQASRLAAAAVVFVLAAVVALDVLGLDRATNEVPSSAQPVTLQAQRSADSEAADRESMKQSEPPAAAAGASGATATPETVTSGAPGTPTADSSVSVAAGHDERQDTEEPELSENGAISALRWLEIGLAALLAGLVIAAVALRKRRSLSM